MQSTYAHSAKNLIVHVISRYARFWAAFEQNGDGSAHAGNENVTAGQNVFGLRLSTEHAGRGGIFGKGTYFRSNRYIHYLNEK